MVLAGQFLERATLIHCDESGRQNAAPTSAAGLVLEGLWHRGEKRPALLICPPHPLRGSSMDSPVCTELAFACSQRGLPTLRFNYRGAGASQGVLTDELESCVRDAAAALAILAENTFDSSSMKLPAPQREGDACVAPTVSCFEGGETGGRRLAVVGYDFGAAVALELAKRTEGLEAVVLIGPHAAGYDIAALADVQVPGLVVLGERDASCDRETLHATSLQTAGVRLELVEEADHVFSTGLTSLGRMVAEFLGGLPGL